METKKCFFFSFGLSSIFKLDSGNIWYCTNYSASRSLVLFQHFGFHHIESWWRAADVSGREKEAGRTWPNLAAWMGECRPWVLCLGLSDAGYFTHFLPAGGTLCTIQRIQFLNMLCVFVFFAVSLPLPLLYLPPVCNTDVVDFLIICMFVCSKSMNWSLQYCTCHTVI